MTRVVSGKSLYSVRWEWNRVKILIPRDKTEVKRSHTHPADAPHSMQDVNLISMDRLRESEVVTPNRIYSLKKTEKTYSAEPATRVVAGSPMALTKHARAVYGSQDDVLSQEDLLRKLAADLHREFTVEKK